MSDDIPKAYIDADIPNRFWPHEPFDDALPPSGWLTDFVLATRGIETPTSISFWSAVFILSSLLKRDVYLARFPFNLYPNFYVIVVAPPRVCAKTTAVKFGEKILSLALENNFKDPVEKETKRLNILRKVTPQVISERMRPYDNTVYKDGHGYRIEHGSEACFIVSELSTMLSREKFNDGLVSVLTNLYDCPDEDSVDTISRGKIVLRDV